MQNKTIIPLAVIIAGVLIGGALLYTQTTECKEEEDQANSLSSEKAAATIIEFVNQNILKGQAEASLVEVGEEKGLYRIKFSIQDQEITSYATKDGELFFPDVVNLAETPSAAKSEGTTIGKFSVSEDSVCKENGVPIVYFFGSESCPHCSWEHPVVREVAEKFGDEISFHDNMDDQETDAEVFQKYSSGGVPTLVIGCKYYRVGSGENEGEEQEKDNLTALLCSLTDNKPGNVCDQVKGLVDQI